MLQINIIDVDGVSDRFDMKKLFSSKLQVNTIKYIPAYQTEQIYWTVSISCKAQNIITDCIKIYFFSNYNSNVIFYLCLYLYLVSLTSNLHSATIDNTVSGK